MNNTEDPFLEDMNWINRTCKKSKKSMSEIEINEDNCVLDKDEMLLLEDLIEAAITAVDSLNNSTDIDRLNNDCTQLFLKITKLNKMAKEKQK